MTLWSDINQLTKDEFGAALDKLQASPRPRAEVKSPEPRKTSKPRRSMVDTPAARITALASERLVQDRDLQRRLVKLLIERGYPTSDFPNAVGKRLEEWLTELMRSVPSAEVMDAATRLLPQK